MTASEPEERRAPIEMGGEREEKQITWAFRKSRKALIDTSKINDLVELDTGNGHERKRRR